MVSFSDFLFSTMHFICLDRDDNDREENDDKDEDYEDDSYRSTLRYQCCLTPQLKC